MALFDRIALLEAELNPQIKHAVEEAQRNNYSMELLFWAPLTIDGNTVIIQVRDGYWQATNVHNITADGVHIRMSQDYWNEWPSPQAFLKWGACTYAARVEDWICFKVIYYAGASLPSNFRDLQYAYLQEKFQGQIEKLYPNVRRLMKEIDEPFTGMLYQRSLPAILDTPDSDDQNAQTGSSLMKRVIRTTQSFFVGTPPSAHRSNSRDTQSREQPGQALAIQNDVTDLAIVTHSASQSPAPSSLGSQMLSNIQTRRTRGTSRDIVATSASVSSVVVPSRARAARVDSNVQSRIAQFQRKTSVGASLERTLNIPSTNSQPLSFGPSPASSSASVALVDTSNNMQPSPAMQSATVESSLIDRLESMQRMFDQSLQRALQENATQYKNLQSQIQNVSGSLSFLQEHILEVDESCRRNCERIEEFEVNEVSAKTQELTPVHEDDREADHDSGGCLGFYRQIMYPLCFGRIFQQSKCSTCSSRHTV